MTTEEIKTTVKKHRPAALFGGVAGLVILIGYLAYGYARTPKVPDLKTAPAAEVVAYVSHDRGLPRLAQYEQEQFLLRWRDVLTADAKKKEQLRSCLEGLKENDRTKFIDAMFTHFKRAFLDDARAYTETPKEQQYAFLKKRILAGTEQFALLKEIVGGMSARFASNQDDFQAWLIEHTTAEERAKGEDYYNALKHVRPQIAKEARTTQPTTRP